MTSYRYPPLHDELPRVLETRILLQNDRHAAVFADLFRLWSNGYTFWLTLVLAKPIHMSFEDEASLDLIPQFGGDPTPGQDDRMVWVTVTDTKGVRHRNRSSSEDRELALLNARGAGDRWEAQFAMALTDIKPEFTLDVVWKSRHLHCAADVSLPKRDPKSIVPVAWKS